MLTARTYSNVIYRRVAALCGTDRNEKRFNAAPADFRIQGVDLLTLNNWVHQYDLLLVPHADGKRITRAVAKQFVVSVRSIRVGQVGFSAHIRSSRKRTLASTTSFLMIAVIATLAGLPNLII